MKIKTFPVQNFRGCNIYYRNFGNDFEYLAVINKQIYSFVLTVKPRLIELLKKFLHIRESQYSETETKAILTQMQKIAETTIASVLDAK